MSTRGGGVARRKKRKRFSVGSGDNDREGSVNETRAQVIELPNGIELHDEPAGNVQRYSHICAGAWQAARVLLYTFVGFPALWNPDTLSTAGAFQHNWVGWLAQLESMEKNTGPWRECAVYLARAHSDKLNTRMILHITRAVIELSLRNAEFARCAYRASTTGDATHMQPILTDERTLMGRIRTAASYRPRVLTIERHLYRALEASDAALLHRIAAAASTEHHVHDLLSDTAI